MANNNNTESYSPKNEFINNIDKCNVSKASGEIMLDRICVNDQKEFPFINFLGN